MFKISRVMSTQHPDNVAVPFFAQGEVMAGEDEIKEAYYAFSHLDCREQLWDVEGKEADNYVVKKLFSRYEHFFRQKKLGEDVYLSMRGPNPRVERADAKILLEALHGVTRSQDLAKQFYGQDAPAPIPQLYIPMVQTAKDVLQTKAYYDNFIIRAQEQPLCKGVTVKEWIGEFGPKTLAVTPLVEDRDSILNADSIAQQLIDEKATADNRLRFWFARSDPALNYGSASCVLLLKVALQRLAEIERKNSVEILPIVGCGSAPFRGHFTPKNTGTMIKGYPSVQTFTIQSSYKYDHPAQRVRDAVALLNETKRKKPVQVEEEKLLPIIDKMSAAYADQVKLLAPLVNRMTAHVPQRRKRKMHIGLFGYSRGSSQVSLPRAIPFTAALYSLGLPPELLGLHALNEKELDVLQDAWKNFPVDHAAAARYYNPETLKVLPKRIQEDVKRVMVRFPVERDEEHAALSSRIADSFARERQDGIKEDVVRAAWRRGFLG